MMAVNERPPFRTVFHMTETFGDPPRVPHGRPPRLGMPVGPLNHNVRAGQDAAGVRNRRPAGPLQAAGLGTGEFNWPLVFLLAFFHLNRSCRAFEITSSYGI
jgi:hypothetical protein